ncbi:hypothetical protein FB451DRAFT_1529128 [Mycena latifolia]|nr:hypothetical protein FB451DRAFT_1529128 [Mycena latifolia]
MPEFAGGLALVMRPRSPQRAPTPRAQTHPHRSRSPPARYPDNHPSTRGRSISPPHGNPPKRPRNEDTRAFISLGPLAESADTEMKRFELHLRTAIPKFRLESPYEVHHDPSFPDHLRVAVVSRGVARALIAAWAGNNVPGYGKIEMREMVSASGRDFANAPPTAPLRAGGTSHRDGERRGRPSGSRTPANYGGRHSEPSRR